MTRSIRVLTLAALLAVPGRFVAAAPPAAAPSPGASPATPPGAMPADTVAVIGGEPFTARQLEEAAGPRLFQIRTQQYQAERQILDNEIAKKLVEREAAARKVTVDDLLQQEVAAKVAPVTQDEAKAYYVQNKERIPPMAEAEAIEKIYDGLTRQRRAQRQAEFVESLRAKTDVRVLLEPPRIEVAAAGNPSRGPADAPITIVEFSDFQCPYCSRALEPLKKIEESYAGKVRLVYRDFPLVQIHPNAARAAEAAACADDQGKFWAMHDSLFAHQDKLEAADIKTRAAELGLDTAAFDKCLESGKHAGDWQKDAADAERYGVSSTPAFFINGRLLVGAQPYEEFAKVIDEELARTGAPSSPSKGSSTP
jgi:protein-disulfide isomerase